jgi:glycosyltransferase involved in cell wall biosynthesis
VKVSLISGEFPPMRGGVADYTALYAASLARLGVSVSVLTSTRVTGLTVGRSVEVLPVVKSWDSEVWSAVRYHIGRVKPDLIHIQYQTGAYSMQLGVNLLPWICRLRGGQPPIIVTFHDLKEPYIFPKIGKARHLATMALVRGADAVVATNAEDFVRLAGRSDGQATSWLWGKQRLDAIPIGSNIPEPSASYDRPSWRAKVGARADEFVIAFFGFLGPAKGVDSLVSGFETLVDRGRSVRLLMIGATSGDTQHLNRQYEAGIRQRLDKPLVRGRVTWTGFVGPRDVGAYLQAADVCCLPFQDGVSLRHGTLIAAITHGLPIVTTRSLHPAEHPNLPVLRDEVNVLVVPPGDAQALARAIDRLITEAALRDKLGNGSRALAGAFGWETIARRSLTLYREVSSRI